MPRERGQKVVATNRKARHDYSIEDTYEAGLVLTGTEVKSLRAGRASLVDGYAFVEFGEAWLDGGEAEREQPGLDLAVVPCGKGSVWALSFSSGQLVDADYTAPLA